MEYPERLTPPLKINAEYERSSHPIQALPQITGSYSRCMRCGRWISGPNRFEVFTSIKALTL